MNSNKKELLDLIAQLCEKYPDMRVGQLVTNLAQWAKGPVVSATWDATNDEMIAATKKIFCENRPNRK
jgi:hypothetical protein